MFYLFLLFYSILKIRFFSKGTNLDDFCYKLFLLPLLSNSSFFNLSNYCAYTFSNNSINPYLSIFLLEKDCLVIPEKQENGELIFT